MFAAIGAGEWKFFTRVLVFLRQAILRRFVAAVSALDGPLGTFLLHVSFGVHPLDLGAAVVRARQLNAFAVAIDVSSRISLPPLPGASTALQGAEHLELIEPPKDTLVKHHPKRARLAVQTRSAAYPAQRSEAGGDARETEVFSATLAQVRLAQQPRAHGAVELRGRGAGHANALQCSCVRRHTTASRILS